MTLKTKKKESKEKIPPKRKKEKADPEPWWPEMIELYFEFYKQRFFGSEPTFDLSAPRDLKNILVALRTRADKSGAGWGLEVAKQRFLNFMTAAFEDKWLSENFLLFNINRQKDKIFAQIANPNKNKNGAGTQSYWRNNGLSAINGSKEATPL
jgi:hypothetical protein